MRDERPASPADWMRAAETFRTLSHPRRLDMLLWLVEAPQSKATLDAAYFDPSKSHDTSTVAQLGLLKAAGLVASCRAGPHGATYSLTDEGRRIMELVAWFVARMG